MKRIIERRTIIMAADHAGFSMKEKIKEYLENNHYPVIDMSPAYNPEDDYPDHVKRFATEMKKITGPKLGILICGSGTGMCIAANRFNHLRAVQAYDTYSAKMARNDEDANVICLRARGMSFRKNKRFLNTTLRSAFSQLQRHKRRIKKLQKLP